MSIIDSVNRNFPPLYECSKCGAPVKVTPMGLGVEPRKEWKCDHVGALIYANRKATCHGKGQLNILRRGSIKIKLTFRQFLSAITGRSI